MYKARRRTELINETVEGEGGFFEVIELFDEHNKVIYKHTRVHPENSVYFTFNSVEYYSPSMYWGVFSRPIGK